MKAVYRILVGLCIALFIVASFIGCGRNISSQAEAIQAASQLPDFGKLISVDSIYGTLSAIERDTMKIDGEGDRQYVIHIVVYEKKDGKTEVVRFDDQRPPQIITVRKKTG